MWYLYYLTLNLFVLYLFINVGRYKRSIKIIETRKVGDIKMENVKSKNNEEPLSK